MKELIIVPKVSKSKMGAFLAEIKQDGVKTVNPKNIARQKQYMHDPIKYCRLKDGCTMDYKSRQC